VTATPPPPARKRGRFWINVGEAAAVIAVVIAGLNYLESRREHADALKLAAQQSTQQAKSHFVIVLKGAAQGGGRRVALDAVQTGQVIQSQRYIFPSQVLDHPMEVTAAQPQIDVGWIEGGLNRALDDVGAKGAGESRVPVAIVTTFVEDGDTYVDRSIYQIGYAYRSRFLRGREIVLQGIALERRGVSGDLQAAVNGRWKHHPSGAGPT